MNNEELNPTASGETEEGFEIRRQSEETALQESLVSSGISEEESDTLVKLLAEKHETEREINTVFPDLDAYRDYKAAVSFTPTPSFAKSVAAPDSIEAVATPISEEAETAGIEEEEVPITSEDDSWKKVVGYINAVDTLDREQKKAESSLLGGKREKGSTLVADQLEEKKTALAAFDERILNKDELQEHRKEKAKVERELPLVHEREAYSKDFLAQAEDAKGGNIELVLQNIQELPEELIGAIRTNDKATLEQYGVNIWAAGRVARALEQQDVAEEKRLHTERKDKDEHRDIARAVGTPELARFSRAEIEAVLAKKGIITTTLAEGLTQLKAEFEKSTKNETASTVPVPHSKKELSKHKTIADHLRAAQERGEVIDEKTLRDVARDAKNPEDMEWAKAELEKRQNQKASAVVTPPVDQKEINNVGTSPEYTHETPDVDEYASSEMIEALKDAGIHVPEGKTLTAFEAQKLRRKVLGTRGSEQIEAIDKRAAQTIIAKASTGTAPAALPHEVKPELSGLYDVREDGHIYNTNDVSLNAPHLDIAPRGVVATSPEADSGALSTEKPKQSVPYFSAENGAVTYDRHLDPNIARDKATLDALMKGRNNPQSPTLPEIAAQEQDPNLSGQYHTENGVVHTGLVEGEGQPVLPDDAQAAKKSEQKEPTTIHEGDPEKVVFNELDVLAYTPLEGDEKIEPLIERNLSGKPQFISDLDAQGEAMQHLIDNTPETINLGRTLTEAAGGALLGTPEELRRERIEAYDREWSSLSDEQKNHIINGINNAYANGSVSAIKIRRTDDAIEEGQFGGILPMRTDVRAYFGDTVKDVPILEFVSMNIPALYAEVSSEEKTPPAYKPDFVMVGEPYGIEDEVHLEKTEEEAQNIFDPEAELAKISKASTSERKVLLEAYKEKLAQQKVGLAKVQAEMVEDIRKNPDMTKEEFETLFNARAEKYQATKEQRAIGSAIFEKFQEKHLAVEKIRSEHPNDAELFATLFGKAPKGAVEVIKGPMTLYFRCHDLEDYALIESGKCLMANSVITDEDKMAASLTAGKGRVRTLVPELSGVVLAENTEGRAFDSTAEQILVHEEQHAINWIIQRGVGEEIDFTAKYYEVLSTIADLEEVNKKLQNAEGSERSLFQEEVLRGKEKIRLLEARRLRAFRGRDADRRAQDEILAYTRDGRNLTNIYTLLTRKKSENGIYDYTSELGKYLQSPVQHLGAEGGDLKLIEEVNADFEAQKEEIFGAEYESVLQSGLDAYQKLRDAGYKEEAIRGIFHDEPLTRWEKVVDRLVKEEKQVPEAVLEKYQAQFNISKETLRSIEGFRELSEGQQLLVLERTKSVAFDDINVEKVSRYRTRIDELSKSDSWWDKIKSVGMKATKQFQLGRMKDEVSAEWLKGTDVDAAAMKRDALEGLVAQALDVKEFGVVEKEGVLAVEYMNEKDFGGDADELIATQIAHFNTLANAYGNMSFSEVDDAGKEALKQQFDTAAREMTQLLAEQTDGKWGGDSAAIWRCKMETAVRMSRFFQDNPEVDKELETAGRNIGSAIGFKNLLAERGTYSLVSGGARFLGVSTLGLAVLPVVAALGGGVMGWRRAKQELSENDLLAAMGEKDKSDDATHEQSGANTKDRAKNVVSGHALAMKLGTLLKEYKAAGDAEKEALKPRLEARVAYTTRKVEEQLVDMGSIRGDRALTIHLLGLTLGNAQSELGFDAEAENAIEARLNSILDIREEKIEANRKTHLVKQAVKGATMGAAFSGAGLLIGGMLPGHATAGSFGGSTSEQDVKAVGDAIRTEPSAGNLPTEITGPQQEAIAKGFTEYMAADAAGKKQIAETLGMTTEQMDAKIANILSLSPGEQFVSSGPAPLDSAHSGEVATLVYNVKQGENLSVIMKGHLGIFRDLTPSQQENVIQNFIRQLSPQDLKDIGITDVNRLSIDQPIQLDRLNEILAAKRIGGEDLFEHAKKLFTQAPQEAFGTTASQIHEGLSNPLSPEDTRAIEQAFGRTISSSESNVLHSMKGLSALAENDGERQILGEALDHLEREMLGAGRPLTTAEMVRILHEHNDLDTKIKFFEDLASLIPRVGTETASSTPLPPGIPKEHIAQWQELPLSVKQEESAILGSHYLKTDMDNLFGKDVLGNPAKEWLILRERSAEEVFGTDHSDAAPSDPSIIDIQDYIKAEGFTEENGYVPTEDETVSQFLLRAHKLRVLAGGPRPEQH